MIYVDTLTDWGWKMRGRKTKSCHMYVSPDTYIELLHSMAKKIGMKREWFQVKPGGMPHYDLTPTRRAAAVRAGAFEVDLRFTGKMSREWRNSQSYTTKMIWDQAK